MPRAWIHKETWALREKKEKKQKKEVAGSEDIILRILRMRKLSRPGTANFISQQLQIMQQEQEKRAKESEQRKLMILKEFISIASRD